MSTPNTKHPKHLSKKVFGVLQRVLQVFCSIIHLLLK